MNRFNLTFSGEILTGYNPADVKRDFGKLFAIDDPERLENFFSGQTVVLRRNLERKDAADYFHQLNLLGAVAALVKVNDDGDEAADPPEQPVAERAKPAANGEEKEVLPRIADIDPNAQVWAVSSRRVRKTPPSGKKKARAAALDSGSRMTGDLTSRIKARLQETQQQAEEAVNAEAEQAALQKQVVEESAQQAEAAARREAEAAARLTAEREEQARREAEETARRKAEEEEQQRREAEAAARLAAEREEQARREAEEAARRKAEEEEQQRREAEAAARLAAEREEQARREAEETARRKAEQEEQQHREAEAAARLTAEREEQARRDAEEAARRRAEQEEQQHREAEAAARLTAEREEQARRDAEEAARRRAEQEEQQHREAEAAARLTAEREEQARREAEEAARRKAEQEERQHRKAEEAARRRAEEEFRQLEAKEAADLKAELEEIKRQEEAEAQRIRADARRRQLQAEQNFTARLRAARSELQLEPIPEESLGANALPGDFNTLRRSTRDGEGRLPTIIKKRQPGEPNLYTLRPFRNTREVQSRCERARRLKKRFYTLGVLGLVLTLVTAQWFFQSAPRPPSTGVSAVASDSGSALVLLSGQSLFLHDRSGVASGEVPLETLGLLSLSAPLAFDPEDSLVAPGVLAGTAEEAGAGERQLLRCNLEESSCRALAAEPDASVDAFVINSLDGSVITAGDSGLVKLSAEGKVIASTEVDLPERPLLRLHAGLLFANSAEGPGISVYRYEDSAFGKQLDEILLLPPAAVEAGHSRVGDFVWSGGAWWASLYDPKSGDLGLYRFDDEWSSLGEVRLPFSSGPIQLSNWGEKTLVNDLRNNALQRYNAAGEAEIPFLSASLENRVAHQRRRANLKELAWRGGLLVAVLLTLLGLGTGALQSLRQRVYKTQRERGAAPVDEESYLIQWIEPVPNRPALLRYRSLCYGLLCAALLLLGIAASVSVWQLAALMLVLAGPAVALMLLARQPIGHIGILGNRLLLVDHSGMYHIAGGSGIQHRGPYLLIDDVVVFCGNTLFPAFQSSEVRELLQSMTAGGVRVDRKTVLVKLLQGRHPLALGAGAILLCAAAAAILLSLQGIF